MSFCGTAREGYCHGCVCPTCGGTGEVSYDHGIRFKPCPNCKADEPKSWEGTDKQKEYWESMKGRSGKVTPRWKGREASKNAMHKWLRKHFGNPDLCSNQNCEGKSQIFEWCLKQGREYSHDPDDYLWLCRSCHRRYDLTPEKFKQAIKNLWWYGKRKMD